MTEIQITDLDLQYRAEKKIKKVLRDMRPQMSYDDIDLFLDQLKHSTWKDKPLMQRKDY